MLPDSETLPRDEGISGNAHLQYFNSDDDDEDEDVDNNDSGDEDKDDEEDEDQWKYTLAIPQQG